MIVITFVKPESENHWAGRGSGVMVSGNRLFFFIALISSTPSPPTRQQQTSMGPDREELSVNVGFEDHLRSAVLGKLRTESSTLARSHQQPNSGRRPSA